MPGPGNDSTAAASVRADAVRNRGRITETAARVLAVNPSASLEEIAGECGLTRVTLYRHFRTREALVNAVYAQALASLEDALAGVSLAGENTDQGMRLVVEALFAVADHQAILVAGPSADFGDPALARAFDDSLAPVRELIRRGQAAGEVDPGLPEWWLADMAFDLIISASWRVKAGQLDRDRVVPLVLETLQRTAQPG